MMFKLVVFDLDGTLVDSREDLAQATNRLLLERGGQPLDLDAVVQMVGEGVEKLVARAFAAAGLQVPPDGVARFLELYGECLLVHTRPYAGVPEVLEDLSHIARLAVLTNKPRQFSVTILSGLGLAPFFSQVLGGDGPHARKPAPDGLLHLLAEFGVTIRDTLLVGDSAIDLRTARAAGTAIALARYGFGFRTVQRDQLRSGELVVDSPDGLIDVVQDRGPTRTAPE